MSEFITTGALEAGVLSALQGSLVYLIGIGGAGMSGMAKVLMKGGCIVHGSDMQPSQSLLHLEELGAKITLRQDGSWLSPQARLVVISAAVQEDNPDLKKAKGFGLRVIKYAQMLGSLMGDKVGIAVSGTHGKTTTTAMVATLLKEAGEDPSFVIGGEVPGLGGSSGLGSSKYFVAEACEYDRSFLHMRPQVGIITNIEEDHLDYYKDLEGVIGAFRNFAQGVSRNGLLVVAHGDVNIMKAIQDVPCNVETFSIGSASSWRATPPVREGGLNSFKVYYKEDYYGDFALGVPGNHNVKNALAAIAVGHWAGLPKESMQKALKEFRGANRRFQMLDTVRGVTVIDDYGHHPTEVCATLQAAKEHFQGRKLWCIFQPHQHTRTRFFLSRFARAFREADEVVFTDIYPARDSKEDMESVSSVDLLKEAQREEVRALYVPGLDNVASEVYPRLREGDVVMTMGAGDVWKVGVELVSLLRGGTTAGVGGSTAWQRNGHCDGQGLKGQN
jgi:UDP-N-acetylmuramate--alanine ligase